MAVIEGNRKIAFGYDVPSSPTPFKRSLSIEDPVSPTPPRRSPEETSSSPMRSLAEEVVAVSSRSPTSPKRSFSREEPNFPVPPPRHTEQNMIHGATTRPLNNARTMTSSRSMSPPRSSMNSSSRSPMISSTGAPWSSSAGSSRRSVSPTRFPQVTFRPGRKPFAANEMAPFAVNDIDMMRRQRTSTSSLGGHMESTILGTFRAISNPMLSSSSSSSQPPTQQQALMQQLQHSSLVFQQSSPQQKPSYPSSMHQQPPPQKMMYSPMSQSPMSQPLPIQMHPSMMQQPPQQQQQDPIHTGMRSVQFDLETPYLPPPANRPAPSPGQPPLASCLRPCKYSSQALMLSLLSQSISSLGDIPESAPLSPSPPRGTSPTRRRAHPVVELPPAPPLPRNNVSPSAVRKSLEKTLLQNIPDLKSSSPVSAPRSSSPKRQGKGDASPSSSPRSSSPKRQTKSEESSMPTRSSSPKRQSNKNDEPSPRSSSPKRQSTNSKNEESLNRSSSPKRQGSSSGKSEDSSPRSSSSLKRPSKSDELAQRASRSISPVRNNRDRSISPVRPVSSSRRPLPRSHSDESSDSISQKKTKTRRNRLEDLEQQNDDLIKKDDHHDKHDDEDDANPRCIMDMSKIIGSDFDRSRLTADEGSLSTSRGRRTRARSPSAAERKQQSGDCASSLGELKKRTRSPRRTRKSKSPVRSRD